MSGKGAERSTGAADQTSADADQTSADADQTSADADQTASDQDRAGAESDQRASDRDQATADRDHAADPDRGVSDDTAYIASRTDRQATTAERSATRRARADAARDRDETATRRDRNASARDDAAGARDAHVGRLADVLDRQSEPMTKQLFRLVLDSAADRARAAEDRQRSARDRADAARERTRLEAALESAHLDGLTGAYRREMGRLALNQEIERARRTDGRLIVAFVDVDRLKELNDYDGHAAGDRALQTVVSTMRARLRSFDPITRYGGDEFVCALGGIDLLEAEARFESIAAAIQSSIGVGISVGLVELRDGETADEVTERADVAMLVVKATHHSTVQTVVTGRSAPYAERNSRPPSTPA